MSIEILMSINPYNHSNGPKIKIDQCFLISVKIDKI